ncbi:MAG TPA: beta-galactosidase, partial [Candidatus Limnocylindrales bacterium]|nr:beta-galactosidase [Candidatus Limnocylindrales bacterium]
MTLGAAYYPEQFPPECWTVDVNLMADAGLRFVRMGEHAWARLETAPGQFSFGWLDACIALFQARQIEVILGTPTACPPPWLWTDDLALVDRDGVRMEHGSRHSYCPNHEGLWEASRRIVEALAAHYANTPGVIAWQLDNELGIVGSHVCYCDRCRANFRSWLNERYGDLDTLNRTWGTASWGARYTDWAQIPSARRSTMGNNPGLVLDYLRFASERAADFARMQAALLRAANPAWTITHNFWAPLNPIHDITPIDEVLDVTGIDAYPTLGYGTPGAALLYDAARAAKRKPFWSLELQARSALNWQQVAPTSRPGQIRLWTAQALARGAERVTYWAWRTGASGAEMYWHGILGHDGRPNRFLDEVKQAASDAAELAQVLAGTSVSGPVAMLNDAVSHMAWESVLKPNAGLRWQDVFFSFYAALYRNGLAPDVLADAAHLDEYPLVIAPLLYSVSPEMAERLHGYVERGGTLVTTFRSGSVTRGHVQWERNPLFEAFNIRPVEFDPRAHDNPVSLTTDRGNVDSGQAWAELFNAPGAEIWARYMDDYFAGEPAIIRQPVGSGALVLFGTLPADLKPWLARICEQADVRFSPDLPEGVEHVER